MHKLLLVLLPAAAAAPLLLTTEDHESIPAEPSRVQARLGEQRLKLPAAVELISKSAGGHVMSASIDPEGGEVTATVYGEGKAWNVVMGQDGKIARKAEIPRFPGWPVTGNWTENDSGLKYYDIVLGEGPTPPSSASTVKVHYTGYLSPTGINSTPQWTRARHSRSRSTRSFPAGLRASAP